MNQNELLERLWLDVIDAVEHVVTDPPLRAGVATIDAQHLARLARYEAIFGWCDAFDEEEISVEEWLALRTSDRRWGALSTHDPAVLDAPFHAPRADDPFADAVLAQIRLHHAGVTGSELAAMMTREARSALAALRTILREETFEEGDLSGLHESLLSADPSGREARPGSWPRPAETDDVAPDRSRGPGPLLRVDRTHELALSPDGLRVVAARSGAITDVGSGSTLATCKLLANTAHVAWSPDGRWIAASSTSGAIAVCDAETGARARVLARTNEGPAPVFSADGAVLYAGDWAGHLYAWEVSTGRELAHRCIEGAMVRVTDLDDEGHLVALVSGRPSPLQLLFLSTSTLEERGARVTLEVPVQHLALDPKGNRALACGHGWVARLDRATGALSERRDIERPRHVALSPDARWYAITTATGFRIGEAADLSRGIDVEVEYASGRAAFCARSKRIAFGTWQHGEVWELDALMSRDR